MFDFFILSYPFYPQTWSPRIYVHICNKPFISSCEYVMLQKLWESKKGFLYSMIYVSCCLQSTFCTFFPLSSLSLLNERTFARLSGTHYCITGPSTEEKFVHIIMIHWTTCFSSRSPSTAWQTMIQVSNGLFLFFLK